MKILIENRDGSDPFVIFSAMTHPREPVKIQITPAWLEAIVQRSCAPGSDPVLVIVPDGGTGLIDLRG